MTLNTHDRDKLRNALDEISNSMTRVSAERDLVNDIKKKIETEFNLSRKVVSRLARLYYNRNLSEEEAEFKDVMQIYEEVVPPDFGTAP